MIILDMIIDMVNYFLVLHNILNDIIILLNIITHSTEKPIASCTRVYDITIHFIK